MSGLELPKLQTTLRGFSDKIYELTGQTLSSWCASWEIDTKMYGETWKLL